MRELITDTVVGAAIGSFITLVGIWLTNHYQSKARKEGREYSIKSDIFMSAVERLASTKFLLMKLPNLSQEELDRAAAQSAATAKLSVIASNETVQTVSELSAAIAYQLLRLFPEKLPLDELRNDIQILSAQIDASFQKQTQMLNEMTASNLRGDNDLRYWNALQKNFDYHSAQIKQFVEERAQKASALNKLMKEFFIKCMEATISLSDFEVKAIACVRRELEMPFDEDAYRKTIRTTNEKMEAEFSKFLVRFPDDD